jgi:hypothetical protein
MKIRPASFVVISLLVFSFTHGAFAQTIQFDKNFMCNGERESVSSCFDDSDAAGCMVMYPDRPLRGGFTVQEVEKRGDVIKKIKGCVGPNATLASTGHPAPAPVRTTSTAPAAPKANTPPPPPDPSVAKARAAGVDMTALGLQLGQAFNLPQCKEVGLADAFGAILGTNAMPAQTYPCASSQAGLNSGQGFGIQLEQWIQFASNVCPAWMNPCAASGMVRNGLLLGAYVNTTGQKGDSAASAQLIAKYGKATQQQAVIFKNVYNYTAQMQKLVWTLPGLYVEYDPFVTDLNQGNLYIETETAHQIRLAAQQAKQAAQPKF